MGGEATHTPIPWMCFIKRDSDGSTVFHIAEHIEPAIALDKEFWHPDDLLNAPTDEFGYYQPDERADIMPHRIANARLIVRAVNSYEAMREAAKAVIAEFYDEDRTDRNMRHTIDKLRAALALAEGGEA